MCTESHQDEISEYNIKEKNLKSNLEKQRLPIKE